jgi:hypothetical protein|tara:strand:- start:1854 stop:3296 length:1443 start_codon:yes stop_codon:yes gene_type:complete
VQVSVGEGEGESGGDGGTLGGAKAGAEGVETAAQEEEERFEGLEGVFKFAGDGELLWWAVQVEETVVFAVQNVVEAGCAGTESLCESLAGKGGEGSQGVDAPEMEEFRVRGQFAVVGLERRERQPGKGLNAEDGMLRIVEHRFRMEGESGAQGPAAPGKEGEIWSGSDGEMERKVKWSGLAEGLFDPVEGGGEGVGKGEEIEQKGAGGGLFKIGSERRDVFPESILMEVFEGGIRGEKNELGAACESTGDGEAGGDAVAGGGSVDGEKKRCGTGGGGSGRRISRRADKGCWFGGAPGTVTEKDRERKGGDVKGGVQVESRGWEKFPGCRFPSGAPNSSLFLVTDGLQIIPIAFEISESEGGIEGELKGGAGDEVSGSKDEEGYPGLPGEIAEAVPGRTGDAAKFLERVEEKVEDEQRETAVVQKEIAAAQGLIAIPTANPEQTGAGIHAVGSRIKGVPAIDEGEELSAGRRGMGGSGRKR